MIIAQAALAVPFVTGILIGISFVASYICVAIYNAVILTITKNEARQLHPISASAILTFILLCYIVYRIATLAEPIQF